MIQPYKYEYDGIYKATLQDYSSDIKRRIEQTETNIMEIGKQLLQAKELVSHGSFCLWIEAEFGWNIRTAQNFMQVARQFKNENFSHLGIGSSILYLLAAPSTPEEARIEALEAAHAGERLTIQKTKEIINGHKGHKPKTVIDGIVDPLPGMPEGMPSLKAADFAETPEPKPEIPPELELPDGWEFAFAFDHVLARNQSLSLITGTYKKFLIEQCASEARALASGAAALAPTDAKTYTIGTEHYVVHRRDRDNPKTAGSPYLTLKRISDGKIVSTSEQYLEELEAAESGEGSVDDDDEGSDGETDEIEMDESCEGETDDEKRFFLAILTRLHDRIWMDCLPFRKSYEFEITDEMIEGFYEKFLTVVREGK